MLRSMPLDLSLVGAFARARVRGLFGPVLGIGILISLIAGALGGALLNSAAVQAAPPALPACTTMPFTDVATSHEFCPEITWLKDKNITSGYSDSTYRPDNAATRMAWSAFLARYAQATLSACSVPPFTDVAVSHPFCPEIKWMKDNAISTGYGDGTYRPGNSSTRMAASAFLARVEGATLSACSTPPFSDVPINHPFCPEITWLKDNAISNGNGDGTFGPGQAITRGESAAWLYRVAVLVNDAPVVTTSAGSTAYTEGDPAAVIDAAITVTDSDDTDLESASVSITVNFETGDELGFIDQNGITGSYNSLTGVLTLTGTASIADYQTALRSVTFATTNDDPATSRTTSFVVNDGAVDSNTATKSITVTPVNDAPVADDETFSGADSAVGNTTLVVDDPTDGAPSASGPKKSISGDILAGDSDADGPGPLTVTPGTFATNDGGSVTIEADGDFVFTPAAGTSCADASDSFDYTVNDNDPIDPQTDTGTVTIAITGCVWYVNNNDPGNSGTSVAPFDTLAQAETASAAGDTIFIFDGDNTTTGYTTGITLKANQQLLGEDANLVIGSDTLWTATANRPTITDNNADAVELASGNTVKGIEIDPQGTGGGIAGGSGDAGGTIDDVRIIDTGTAGTQPGLELDGTSGTWNISNLTVSTNGAIGVRLNSAGTVNFTAAGAISITTSGAKGLDAVSTNMGTSIFDDITVTGSGSGAVSMTNTTGTTTFGDGSGADLALTTTSGATGAFVLSNAGTVTVPAGGTANVSATGGPAIDVTGTAGAALAFDDVDSTNSSTDGINLDGLAAGTFSATSGDITGAAGIGFDLNGGSGDVTYPGNFGNGSGTTAIEITGRSGGAVTLSGSISDTNDAGGGLNVASNTGGSTTLSNATKVFNTGTGAAVTFSASDGHTLTLSGGGLDIDATSGNGLAATTSGTLVVTGTGNTITTTTGTALNVTNTDIGAGGMTFSSISANGATNGIVLNTTGGSGALTVTGSSSGDCGGSVTVNAVGTAATVGAPVTADCTGGTIQASTGAGVLLNNTDSPSLTRMRILNSGADGINALNVDGFTLDHSLITDSSGAAGDRGIEMGDFSTGTPVSGTITVTNSTIGPTPHDNMGVGIASGTSTWTITSTVFTGSVLNSGFNFENRNATVSSMVIDSSVFQNQFADGIQMQPASGTSGTITSATIQSSTIQDNNIGMDLNHDGTASVTYKVLNNTFLNQASHAVNFFSSAVQAPTTGGTLNGRFVGNAIGNAATFKSGSSIGNGIRINVNGGADVTVLLDNNTIRQTPNGRGIEVIARNGTGGLDVTLTNNNVDNNFTPTVENGGFSLASIFLQSNCVTVCNTLRSDIRSNTVPAEAATGDLAAGQLILIETGTPDSTNQLVDNAPGSASALAELQSHNTGSVATAGTIALIAGPINTPP